MRTLALPLRVTRDGQLERAEAADTLLALVRAMVAASPGGGTRFGVHEVFRSANPALHDQQGLADALNEGLSELGIDWAHVASVHTAPAQRWERSFAITLRIEGEQAVHGSVGA
ncbi:MAG TPA: hypothetical protein VF613_05665 [Longimicrobium sp.]|jgi:hypothetical protein